MNAHLRGNCCRSFRALVPKPAFFHHLNVAMGCFKIVGPKHVAAFIVQVDHEFGHLLYVREQGGNAYLSKRVLLLSGLPAVKTVEQYDFEFASGVPQIQILELAGLAWPTWNARESSFWAFGYWQDPLGKRSDPIAPSWQAFPPSSSQLPT